MFAQTTVETTNSTGSPTAGIIVGVVGLVLGIITLIGFWKTLEKGGESGAWALFFLTGCLTPLAFIPVARLTGRSPWLVVLLFIPLVNIVVIAILSIGLAKSFGKGAGFGVGLWLLGFIFYPILGFGSAAYSGPDGVLARR